VIGEEERQQYLKIYKDAFTDRSITDVYAENIGDFALLFDQEKVSKNLLPLFFQLAESRYAITI